MTEYNALKLSRAGANRIVRQTLAPRINFGGLKVVRISSKNEKTDRLSPDYFIVTVHLEDSEGTQYQWDPYTRELISNGCLVQAPDRNFNEHWTVELGSIKSTAS